MKQKERLVQAMVQEAVLQKDYLQGETVNTIYFGGGTPSLLSKRELDQLLDTLARNYPLASDMEITLEANPDDLSAEKLQELKRAGVNRLSIGIQSFQNEHLRFMNRAHSAEQAQLCMQNAREAGFENISIDLIYAVPAADHTIWQQDMATALKLKPEHVSSYCLTIEPQTAFGNWLQKGRIKGIDEEYAAQQFELLLSTLKTAGYEQYEISNFCLPGMYSRHNSSYWQQQAYLGIGPSAHSFNRVSRQYNVRNNARYIKAIESGELPFEREELNKANQINEYLLTGLRTKWGCSLEYLNKELNYNLELCQGKLLTELKSREYIQMKNGSLVLTDAGKLLADEIVSQLMVSDEL